MEDNRIVALLLERSEQALTVLSAKYGGKCHTIAHNVLGNHADAEECVNDALLGVWNSVPPHRPDPLSAYVYRVTRNTAIKRYRANTAAKRNSHYDVALEELESCLPAAETVEQAADAAVLAEALNAFLAILSTDDRVLFLRRYWYTDPVTVLAAATGTSPHYVSVRLSRIRQKLRTFLEKEGIVV